MLLLEQAVFHRCILDDSQVVSGHVGKMRNFDP
jgi:hypothetical protein